jgi:hypothetical protein
MLDTLTRLCPDLVDAVSGYVTTWACIFSSVRVGKLVVPPCVGLRHHLGRAFLAGRVASPQWDGYCEGVNGALLEVFATDTRRQALATCERHAH